MAAQQGATVTESVICWETFNVFQQRLRLRGGTYEEIKRLWEDAVQAEPSQIKVISGVTLLARFDGLRTVEVVDVDA